MGFPLTRSEDVNLPDLSLSTSLVDPCLSHSLKGSQCVISLLVDEDSVDGLERKEADLLKKRQSNRHEGSWGISSGPGGHHRWSGSDDQG